MRAAVHTVTMTPTPRCAAYARYSTDRQNPLSTQDQLAKLQQFATERGWIFSENHVYTDEEISGATLDRPGLRSLLADAESKPRPFDVLLLEDASRLSRKQSDILNLCERLMFAGVTIHFVSQGIASSDEQFHLLLLARGMIDQLFLADTAKRVRRGLEGLIRRGLHTGGRIFGYRSRKDPDGTRLEIYEIEAAVVRRIFEMYAEGQSLKSIAKRLNLEGVESPRPQKGRFSRSWCPSTVRVILRNERYTGKVLWSRKHKVRDPRTGRRVFRVREGEQPIRGTDAPHLRIVSDGLWNAVCERRELVKRVYEDAAKRPGLLRSSAMNSPYLFSGLLRCKECGANLQIVSGRGRNHRKQIYGCPMNFLRGNSVCGNSVRVRRDVLETELLAEFQRRILREDVLNYALDRFEAAMIEDLKGIGDEMDAMRRRKAALQEEVKNLASVLAQGVHSPTVITEIAMREQEIFEIGERLLSSDSDSIRSRVKALRAKALARMQNLRECLTADPAAARAYLAQHLSDKIEMAPDGKAYVAAGSWNLLGAIRWDGAEGQS